MISFSGKWFPSSHFSYKQRLTWFNFIPTNLYYVHRAFNARKDFIDAYVFLVEKVIDKALLQIDKRFYGVKEK